MRVPKMVKNGFNSVSARFCRFEKADQYEEFQRRAKPKAVAKLQKTNKNHSKSI
jgi:hypothetical protein